MGAFWPVVLPLLDWTAVPVMITGLWLAGPGEFDWLAGLVTRVVIGSSFEVVGALDCWV